MPPLRKGGKSFSIWAVLMLLALTCEVLADQSLVHTSLGNIQGTMGNGWVEFLGIPYAEPPVGDLRWAKTVPKASWSPYTLNATSFGNACPQFGDFFYPQASENCLFLNVWTPIASDPLNNPPWPVMVYIHGGGWTQGAGSQPEMWGYFMANSTNRVVVTLNYRLGVLGWMVSESLQGNWGTFDQQTALAWVHNNIAAFGGNPNDVTIFGQSAGGHSVMAHLIISNGLNYFQRAILQSCPPSLVLRSKATDSKIGAAIAGFLDCIADDVICMRSRNLSQILAAQGALKYAPSLFPLADMPFQPTLDGELFVAQPLDSIRAGNYSKVPVLIGNVANETFSFVYGALPSAISETEYVAMLGVAFQLDAIDVLHMYPPQQSSDYRTQFSVLATDFVFRCPARALARYIVAKNNNNNNNNNNIQNTKNVAKNSLVNSPPSKRSSKNDTSVSMYLMTHVPSWDPENPGAPCQGVAVCHGADVSYVYHSDGFFPQSNASDEEQLLSWHMMNYWTEAAPNPVPLPVYDPTSDQLLILDFTIQPAVNDRSTYCDFWDKLYNW